MNIIFYVQISAEKVALQKELKGKEVETKDLLDVVKRLNSNNLDLGKLYDVSRVKAEATALLEERNELRIQLTQLEGAHNLLEGTFNVILYNYVGNYVVCETLNIIFLNDRTYDSY